LEGAEHIQEKGREERESYWNLYGWPAICNFRSKTANVAGVKAKGKQCPLCKNLSL
jgi:hypothetical protein